MVGECVIERTTIRYKKKGQRRKRKHKDYIAINGTDVWKLQQSEKQNKPLVTYKEHKRNTLNKKMKLILQ